MTPDETAAALAYASQLDARIDPNPALHDLWSRELAYVPAQVVRAALLDFYSTPLPQGVRERRKVEAPDVRRLSSKHRPRCEDHDEWPADRCLPCRDEVADGNRALAEYGKRKHTELDAARRAALIAYADGPGTHSTP